MDFAFALFSGLVVTGGIVLWDRLQRRTGTDFKDKDTIGAGSRTAGIVIEYARAFFPVILVVFVLRSFVVEPFRIPSGSMLPSLYIGDFILVSKSSYGIRLPLVNQKIFSIGTPKRGDDTHMTRKQIISSGLLDCRAILLITKTKDFELMATLLIFKKWIGKTPNRVHDSVTRLGNTLKVSASHRMGYSSMRVDAPEI